MAGSGVLTGTFAGRYTIERELGSGATATVYLARDTQRGMSVAVKLLRPELSQSVGAERFLREIRLNESLHHPHIVPVLDSGEHEGRLYFVLPHMEEGSLRQLLQREKQLPIERAIGIAKTIAQALDYAHQQNLIHRDVKPENILFTAGQACLADFGIARAVERAIDESTTETGLVRGTPAYMSPEQASGSKHYDGRSDQYSLACVLYEMLAGIPAFIGPTPEAVIAMRFKYAPRPLSVFRPTVSEQLEALLARALAVSPADRFGTAAEFAAALDNVPRTPTMERGANEARPSPSRRTLAVASAIGVVGLLSTFAVGSGLAGQLFGNRLTEADSVRYAILPIEGDSALHVSEVYDRLHQSFAAWSGIELSSRFDVREAIGSESPVITDLDATNVARRLRAGRYVRARVARAGSGIALTAILMDAVGNRRLFEVRSTLASPLGESGEVFDRVAANLLLQTAEITGPVSRVAPAAQLYLRGLAAQRAFQLGHADSLLSEAVERDRDFGAAALWLAQVRAWRVEDAGVDNWLPWAERALAAESITPAERLQARALVALGRRRFDDACALYRSMIASSDRSFEGWYGLGQCLDWDRAVVRDARSPSGWRFRSSYHRAVQAYVRAFELAPLMHRNFEPHAFTRLRGMLYAGRALGRPGAALPPDSARFLAYPEWKGDSLVFTPYPLTVVRGGGVRPDRLARARATEQQQLLFGRIARTWSAAFPRNASAKEAVAVALEMAGDPSALDTLQLARQLAEDPDQRLRLAAEEVLLRVSLSRRNPALLSGAAAIADSLLAATSRPTVEDARLLGPLAVLRGRCGLSARYAALTALLQFPDFPNIPRSSVAAADSLGILLAMGCDTLRLSDVDDIVNAAAAAARVESAAIPQLEYSLFARAYLFAPPRDAARLRQLSGSGGALMRAVYDLASGDTIAVTTMLARRERQRSPAGTADVTPDAVYRETVLWLAVGDSATARSWADPMLRRASWLELLLDDSFATAAAIRLALLRSQLASAAGDRESSERWRPLVQQLWGSADPELMQLVRQMGR